MNVSTLFSLANVKFRNNDFESAIALYEEALSQAAPPLKACIRFNLEFALRRLRLHKNINEDTSIDNLRSRLKIIGEIESIRLHFDHAFYLSNNPDVAQSGIDPVEHYCTVGWQQKRDPHSEFSTSGYLQVNADVSEADLNPFVHWVVDGRLEGRVGRPPLELEPPRPIAKLGLFNAVKALSPIKDSVDIIVPIFNAYDDVHKCLDRLHRNTPITHRVILIDDASTELRIQPLCADFVAKRPSTVLLSNPSNQGFIATVNRGFTEAIGHVVLLNTDAFVPVNWLDRLLSPILADPTVATVTPMTNNGEIANVPVMCKAEALPAGVADKIDSVARRFDPLKTLSEVPTGVGFCMAMSRDWLNKVPNFDTVFGRGYGEEVDWCQRVLHLGGKHLLTGALFVEHRGGMSFGEEKQARIAANNSLISQRYPSYDFSVHQFVMDDPAIAPRLALGLALLGTEGEIPIYLAHRLGGGAEIWLKGVIDQRLIKNQSTVVVRDGDSKGTALIELYTITGVAQGNVAIDELAKYIGILPKKELIYSCLVASSDPLSLIDTLVKNMTATDRLRILFHDYFPVCPSYTLIGADNAYCDLPDPSACEGCYQCVKEKTGNLSVGIKDWRARWKAWLERAYEIEVFSQSSKEIIRRVWPEFDKKIMVKPHKMDNPPRKIKKNVFDYIVLGVLGSIGYQKGAKFLHDLAAAADERLKIVVIGEIDPTYAHPKIHAHGRFSRHEISELAERYSINCWLLPSIWPETFSYTTHECLATGLPTLAFDIGAQGDTVRIHTNGFIIQPSISTHDLVDKLTCVVKMKTPFEYKLTSIDV
jgi:GT2 family glycosyltransferase